MSADYYELSSLWNLAAPAEQVWQVLTDVERWPDWWPHVESVEKVDPGEPSGRHSVWRYTWRTMLPYKLRFELCVTRVEAPVALEGDVKGDVAGRGVCRVEQKGDGTLVRYEWEVRVCRPWMKWLAPIARPIFLWNHRMVMRTGGERLAMRLAQGADNRAPSISRNT